jgi:alginate O-acetyltransferase complex protein AlgI
MTFASKTFILYFFPTFLFCYFAFKNVRIRNFIFIIFSLLFYSASRPIFLSILLLSIAANFALAIAIDKSEDYRRHWLLACGVAGNLLVLIAFKYTAFLIENLDVLLGFADVKIRAPHITLPLGISFYTFHAISYIADVAKRRVAANRRFDEFMLYMSMFPQLVAGPIVRYSTVAKQLHDRHTTAGRFSAGMRIFVIGLAWKVLIADQIAPVADFVFDDAKTPGVGTAWLGLYAYAMQIYFDFGGYSAMAVGLGVMTGFVLPRNFRIPYAAASITAFWRRWHMSLSTWLRDYLYIPLGGSRGTALQTYINLWTVFLLCGLWHGANWTFVIWGGYHGLFLALERAGLGRWLERLPKALAHLYALLVVFLGWVWFRANDLSSALSMFKALAGLNGMGELPIQLHILLSPIPVAMLIVAGALGIWKWRTPLWSATDTRGRAVLAAGETIFFLFLVVMCIIDIGSSVSSPFLYYRF